MTREDLIRKLRHLKLRLSSGGRLRRGLVPFVEVGEFWLSHGFREVVARSRTRLSGGTTVRQAFAIPSLPELSELTPLMIPAPAGSPGVSIVIPVFNNPGLTRRCLAAIVENTEPGSYEVIVVDNASDAITRDMLAAVAGLRVIRNEENAGFVGACNQGAADARGDFVLFLNNDTAVLGGWLTALRRTFDDHERVGAVGAKLIYPDGRLQEAGGIIWRDGHGWNYGNQEHPDAPEYGYVREVDYCSGACLIVRRQLFDQLGGFDTRYSPAYYEDADLAFRLRETGYRVLFQPAAHVVHFEGATSGRDVSKGFKTFQAVNRPKFVERHAAALAAQSPHDPNRLRAARDRNQGRRVFVMDHMVPHYDEDSGSVRMMALLRILVDLGCRVTFYPDNLAAIEPYTSELQQLGVEVMYGPVSEKAFLRERDGEFDIAILCRARFAARYLRPLRRLKRRPWIVFDTVDLHFLREERLAALEHDADLARSAARTRELEMEVVRASDQVWVTSTHEADLLRREHGVANVRVVPNIHTIRTEVPPFGSRQDILFIGGFRHAPNEDAVLHFVNDIFPLVRHQLPGVRLVVVGSHVPPSVSSLASDDVVVRGFVRDVRPVFDASRLSVAPLRYGAGVKGKVTQSLAWGLPVVATPVAAEGLEMKHAEHLMIAAEPAEFARSVVALYQDEALWTRLSSAGRRRIDERLGYAAVRASLAALLDEAVRRPD